jgi:hypothetical protein
MTGGPKTSVFSAWLNPFALRPVGEVVSWAVMDRGVAFFALFLPGCSSQVASRVGISQDAGKDVTSRTNVGDASPDAQAYLACMSVSGQIDTSLKTCNTASDCVVEREQTDCCGAILDVGVNSASVSKFIACETAWVAHFPDCVCMPNAVTTEDGTTLPDGTAPGVQCFVASDSGLCLTYFPASITITCLDAGPADAACDCSYNGISLHGACSQDGLRCGGGCEQAECVCVDAGWHCAMLGCK